MMKINFLGNVCNMGYWMAKWCHQLGLEAQLFIGPESYERDMPWWDDSDLCDNTLPKWVKRVLLPTGKEFLPLSKRCKLYAEILDCDIIHSFSPDISAGLLGFPKPQVYQSMGGFDFRPFYLRYNHAAEQIFDLRRLMRVWRFRRLIRNVDEIIISQPYELPYALYFRPLNVSILPIPYQIQPPSGITVAHEKRFFAPARHYWYFKGNDLLLQAYSKLLNDEEAKIPPLILLDWGPDVKASKELAHNLGISSYIKWQPLLDKRSLYMEMKQSGTIVVDQFGRPIPDDGFIGGIGRDALSVCAQLISNITIPALLKVNTSAPPVFAVSRPSVEAVLEQLRLATAMSRDELAKLGRAGHDWLVTEHDWKSVVPRYITLYEQMIRATIN